MKRFTYKFFTVFRQEPLETMEEDTSNDQTQLQKMRGLISRFKPSRKKVRLFSLSLSAIGIIVCIFLLVRAYVYQKYGLIFAYSTTDVFINEKLFQGYEGALLMEISYFFQGIALNSPSIEKYPDTIGKISKFLMFTSMFILFPSLWFYCSSTIPKFESTAYTVALVFSVNMTLNIFSSGGQIEENLLQESSMLLGCTIGTLFFFINSFIATNF
jgi:hypothetical protein